MGAFAPVLVTVLLAACANGSCASRQKSVAPDTPGVVAASEENAATERSASSSPGAASVPFDWKTPTPVDRGPAFAGPWRMNDSRFLYVDDPTVASRSEGGVFVAWVDNVQKNVLFQSYDRRGQARFGEPIDVSKSPDIFSWLPRIAVGQGGHVYALWQEIVFSGGTHGGEAFFARSTDGGRHFSAPLNLSNTQAGCGKGRLTQKRWHNGSLDLAVGSQGEVFAVWTEYEGPLRFSRSADGGNTFSSPLRVSGAESEPARGPSLAVGPEGTLYLAWTASEDAAGDIHWSRSQDGGRTFSDPSVALRTEDFSDAPKLVIDDQGSVHMVFAERQGMFGKARVVYARQNEGAKGFSAPRVIGGSQRDPGEATADFPSFSRDDDGRLYVIWEHHPHGAEEAHGLGMTFSSDRGRSFVSPFLVKESDTVSGINGSLQGKLMRKLDVGPKGRVAVVNSYFDPGNRSLVRLFRAQ